MHTTYDIGARSLYLVVVVNAFAAVQSSLFVFTDAVGDSLNLLWNSFTATFQSSVPPAFSILNLRGVNWARSSMIDSYRWNTNFCPGCTHSLLQRVEYKFLRHLAKKNFLTGGNFFEISPSVQKSYSFLDFCRLRRHYRIKDRNRLWKRTTPIVNRYYQPFRSTFAHWFLTTTWAIIPSLFFGASKVSRYPSQ